MTFLKLAFIGFLFGIGFGYFVQRAGLCFANGLGEIFIGRGKRIARFFIVIFVITSAGFLLSGYVSPTLGLTALFTTVDTMLRWTPPQRWSPSGSMLMNTAVSLLDRFEGMDSIIC